MKSVLYQLYDGRLCPHADQRPRIKEHKLLLEKQSLQYEYLANELGKINPALKDNFHAMMESLADQIFWDTSEVFIDGFCLGVRLIQEVYHTEYSSKED